MATILTHAKWMADTSSLLHSRSYDLKKLDEAILVYDKSKTDFNRRAVKTAFDAWTFDQTDAGKDWRKSVRNQKGAVTALHRALINVDRRALTPKEKEALEAIAADQAAALHEQFKGKTLMFKGSTLAGMANSATSGWQRFKTGADGVVSAGATSGQVALSVRPLTRMPERVAAFTQGGAVGGRDFARSDAASLRPKIIAFIKELCPGVNPQTVFDALRLGNVEQFAVNLAPFLGTISSGGKALIGWIGVAKLVWDKDSVNDQRDALRAGDPMAAFEALLQLLEREIASESVAAGRASAAFTGKLLGTFLDGGVVSGPVLGALETLAQIFQTIVEFVKAYKELEAGNEALKLGKEHALNMGLFRICPVLGCYFLVIQPHSTIINFVVADYGTPNWMMDVEMLVKRIDIVLEKSRRYIRLSKFEIPGMERARGIVEADWSHQSGGNQVLGAPGAALSAIGDKLSDQIDEYRAKATKPKTPPAWKANIVGQGSR